jgi:hypothetical protein
MTTGELCTFVREQVPGFSEPTIEMAGSGYHYTCHTKNILTAGVFLGVPITSNLISTQRSAVSTPARDSDGIVFAYPSLQKTAEMGLGQEIFRIDFRSGISAFHTHERELERKHGLIDSRTLLILASEIVRFEFLGSAAQLLQRHSWSSAPELPSSIERRS